MVDGYWQVQLPIRVSQLVIQIIHLGCGLIQIHLITVMNGCKQNIIETCMVEASMMDTCMVEASMMDTKLFFQLIERAMELFM